MGEMYRAAEEQFLELRPAIEQETGIDLSDISFMSTDEYLDYARQRPGFNMIYEEIIKKSPLLFSPSHATVVCNEYELMREQVRQRGFNLSFYVLHELSHALQWALGDYSSLERKIEQHDRDYASLRKKFCEAEPHSDERREMLDSLKGMLEDMREPKKVLAILKEGFAVYFPLECLDLESLDCKLAETGRMIQDGLRIHAATGEDPLGVLLRGWEGAYSAGYDFHRRVVDLADGDRTVLQDIIRCPPTSLEEIENPERYWTETLQPYREARKDS